GEPENQKRKHENKKTLKKKRLDRINRTNRIIFCLS
ncbi:MAG: hypothetical protein H6Q41_2261, partial [Deltaproteobacteria bacterium]|nr:hypothetical protein [Deltaproteobacteria bacterium]